MRILLTRPLADSLATAKQLSEKKIETLIDPLFEIRAIDTTFPDFSVIDGLIFTSRHAVRIFAEQTPHRFRHAYCVGDQTAQAALKAGFKQVISAEGDEEKLARLILASPDRKFLRLIGYEQDHLGQVLTQAGCTVHPLQIYDIDEKQALLPETIACLEQGHVNGAMFFSPKTVSRFYALLHKQELAETCRPMTAWCISEKTAMIARELPFKKILVAAKPTQKALLDLIF